MLLTRQPAGFWLGLLLPLATACGGNLSEDASLDSDAEGTGGSEATGGSAATGGAPTGVCELAGKFYQQDEAMPSNDGCNTCTCDVGFHSCTLIACPKPCGGEAGDTCSNDEYCDYAVGELCGQADAQSQCLGRPDLCLDNYEPVCGCDGITYSNFCAANAAGFGVMSEGECSP